LPEPETEDEDEEFTPARERAAVRRPPGRCQRWCRRPRRNHQHRRVTMPGPPSPRPARPDPTPTSPWSPRSGGTSQQRGRGDPQTVIG